MSFNLRHLKYFVATAELGQVSRAAMELSVSQSAVTAAIRELEQTLGATLFTRSSHGMTLTEAGRRFLSSGYEILSKVDEALQSSLSRLMFHGSEADLRDTAVAQPAVLAHSVALWRLTKTSFESRASPCSTTRATAFDSQQLPVSVHGGARAGGSWR